MRIIHTQRKLCTCCMEVHEVKTIAIREKDVFKGVPVEYDAMYFFCSRANETYADEQQIAQNDIALKNAYRTHEGLLTSDQIIAIRARYGISQSDLCLLLGWRAKTITRYESHQVQDIAHDTILRKLDADPEWFLKLLQSVKTSLSPASYSKYLEAGTTLFEQNHDLYLKSAIMARYARYGQLEEFNGNASLSLDVVVDMIHYFSNSPLVTGLYLVKLMKMLWYADALSFKRRAHAISGLVYRALPMGAVPVAYESIIDLSTIHYEEIDMGDGTGYRFLPAESKAYPALSAEDREILDAIIERFGRASKKEIVETMHSEAAYAKTAANDMIPFRYTTALSLS